MRTNPLAFLTTGITCCMCLNLAAQETQTGTIFEKGTSTRIPLVNITNKSTKQSVGTNSMGFFQISATIGDTLVVTKKNFTDQYFIINNNADLIVHLVRSSLNLAEITVKAENKKQNLTETKLEHHKKTYFYGNKRSIFKYLKSPFSLLQEWLSPERKNAKRFDKYYNIELKELEVDAYFNTSIIQRNTTLTGVELDKFLLDYRPNHKQIRNWNTYDAISYIKKSAKYYLDTLNQFPQPE